MLKRSGNKGPEARKWREIDHRPSRVDPVVHVRVLRKGEKGDDCHDDGMLLTGNVLCDGY